LVYLTPGPTRWRLHSPMRTRRTQASTSGAIALRVLRRHREPPGDGRGVHHGLPKMDVGRVPRRRAAARLDQVVPTLTDSPQIANDLPSIRSGGERRVSQPADDRSRVALAVGGQRIEVARVSVSSPADNGTVTFRVSSWPRSMGWMSDRPVRPLPSDGWSRTARGRSPLRSIAAGRAFARTA
jgi:hypothetical protein